MLLSCPLSCILVLLSGLFSFFEWHQTHVRIILPPYFKFFMGGETIYHFGLSRLPWKGPVSSFFVLFWLLSFQTCWLWTTHPLSLADGVEAGLALCALKVPGSRNRFDAVSMSSAFCTTWWMILLNYECSTGSWCGFWRRKSCSEGKGYYSNLDSLLFLVLSEQTLWQRLEQ